eukprot:GFUD01037490.1.p1 GENE.GFUD01037490.1~~GFUD01037490.1.p1  ORF type:complete len:541 (-),score=159.18 GFUD01037490.1:552-2174(-)
MFVDILVFVVAFLLFLYYRGTRNYKKYKLRGIAQAEPTWPLGSKHNWKMLFAKGVGVSDQYGVFMGTELEKEKMFGIYGHPDNGDALIINDLDLAKRMMVKDFDHFVDRTDFGLKLDETSEADMMFGHSFIMQKGDDWKKNRNLMTPVFTTGKLKLMYNLLEKCGTQLEDYIANCSKQNIEIDAKDVFGKFALDGIATSGFGIESNSFKDPDNMFRRMVMELMRMPGSESGSNYEITKLVLKGLLPMIEYIVSVPNVSPKGALFLKDVLTKTIKHRENTQTRRNDIIDLIIDQIDSKKAEEDVNVFESEFEEDAALDMSNVKKTADKFDKERTLVSNAFLLFIAALDTTSSTLTFIIHFFMKHPEVQEKARDEIMEIIGPKEKVTFDHIQSLKYLDNVIYETLRHAHPFAQILERECTKDYIIPGTDYVVRKGEIVNFSFLYERMRKENESFYNSGEYDPDNFDASNNPDTFSFLGFGQGPRNCIGKRYAMISIKIALVSILRSFQVVKTENTKEKLEQFKFLAGAEVPFYALPLVEMEE